MNKKMLGFKVQLNHRYILLRAMLLAVLVLAIGSFSTQLYAQNSNSSRTSDTLILTNDDGKYQLAPYMFITEDSHRKLNPSSLMQRHDRGIRGEVPLGSVVNLGMSTDQHWIVLNIRNSSWNEDWILSFGDNLTGQSGYMQNLIIRNNQTQQRIVNTVQSAENNPYVRQNTFDGHTTPFKIKRGEELVLVWQLKSDSTVPLTMVPTLYKASEYTKAGISSFKVVNIYNVYFLIIAGLLLGSVIFRKIWMSGILLAYILAQAVLFHYQDNFFFSPTEMREAISNTTWVLCLILGLIFTKYFLVTERDQRLQTQIIVGFSVVLIVSCWIANFFMDRESIGYWVLSYVPGYLSVLFMTLLSLAQARTNSKAVYLYTLGWLVYFIGITISDLTLVGLLPSNPLLISASWLLFIPQGIFFVMAVVVHDMQRMWDEDLAYKTSAEEFQTVRSLKKTKEEAEIGRLVRLVEHERDVMNELREREMVQSEAMKKALDKAEEADRAKSAFLAVVSHEIRTPMTGIMGMVKLLQDTSLTSSQKDYAVTIQDSGDAMMALLNDILDFEKIESGKLDLEFLDFDLNRLLRGVVTLMSGHAETKGIWLKLDIADDVPGFVIGDPVRLRQVLLNLVGNAIKFTSDGGVNVKVEIDPTYRGDQHNNMNQIRFSVEDTGIGISQEAQRDLFNPFSQADSSITRKFGGTGLGLAICRRLIEAMAGEILIDSTEGHGSTFFFSILLEEGDAKVAQSAAEQKSIGGLSGTTENAQRILIVDDNEINQKLLKELVTRLGHEIDLASSGEDAVALAINKPFDMILMDIQLPGISGIEATKRIRASDDPKKAQMPIIALTGNVSEQDISACLNAGMNAHLEKPVDPLKLKKTIAKLEQGGSYSHSSVSDTSSGNDTGSSSAKDNYMQPAQAIRQGQDVISSSAKQEEQSMAGNVQSHERSVQNEDYQDLEDSDEADPESPSAVAPITQFVHGGNETIVEPAQGQNQTQDTMQNTSSETDKLDLSAQSANEPASIVQPDYAAPSDQNVQVEQSLTANNEEEAHFGDLSDEDLEEDSFEMAISNEDLEKPVELSLEGDPNPAVPAQPEQTLQAAPAQTSPPQSNLVDKDVFSDHVLKDLVNVMPEAELRELVNGFFDKADEILAVLNKLDASDATNFKARVHELKGMAGNFGFMEIHNLAEKAEHIAEQDNLNNAINVVPELSQARVRAKTALDQWLTEVSAA